MTSTETVFLVDDDPAIRRSLRRLLSSEGWNVVEFESADAFLAAPQSEFGGCLVLDVTMPGVNGLELQRQLTLSESFLPIVFLTGYGDIPMTVRAIKSGAADFLTKPVQPEQLLAAIHVALENGRVNRRLRADLATQKERYRSLTPREREVFAEVAKGRLNKQIAIDLGVVEQTVKFHRARIMKHMQAGTVAELMLIAARLGIAEDLTKD